MQRTTLLVILLAVLALAFVGSSAGKPSSDQPDTGPKWEYLAVAGPGTTNFSPSGNSKMRKSEGGFGREAFVLEQHLDKLGAEGWELVSVAGNPQDPVYYFKKAK
jgi:hypothetical protein